MLAVSVKGGDTQFYEINATEHLGEAPDIDGLCGGDYFACTICLDCGQIQGTWPKPEIALEAVIDIEGNSDDMADFEFEKDF